jgi:hypothetical protein
MNPIRVLLCHREDWYRGEPRIDGQFAYPVPQFTWRHMELRKGFKVDLFKLPHVEQYDVVWLDDGKYKSYAQFSPNVPHGTYLVPQVVMYALYPTLSAGHYRRRLERARHNADLILVDHDDLGRWERDSGMNVRRLAYSVNERYYRDRGYRRDIDVGFYCVYGWNRERPALDTWLAGFCERRGYTYQSTNGKSIGVGYADLLARTKVVVHLNRTPHTRPPRIFDCAASGAALLSNYMPEVSGENWLEGYHYASFAEPCSKGYVEYAPSDVPVYDDANCDQIVAALEDLIDNSMWEVYAQAAKQYVLSCHTWAHRAKELYGILLDNFPRLRKDRGEWMYRS